MSQLPSHLHIKTNSKTLYQHILQAVVQNFPKQKVPKQFKLELKNYIRNFRIHKAMSRYVVPKHATAAYVRHIIRIAYKQVNLKKGTVHKNLQPVVKTIRPHTAFLIITPHKINGKNIKFYYAYEKGGWKLFTKIEYNHQIINNDTTYQAFLNQIKLEETNYQIGHWSKNWFYIPIEQYSLQYDYYRLIDFAEQFTTFCQLLYDVIKSD